MFHNQLERFRGMLELILPEFLQILDHSRDPDSLSIIQFAILFGEFPGFFTRQGQSFTMLSFFDLSSLLMMSVFSTYFINFVNRLVVFAWLDISGQLFPHF